jgi:hypothetical protein
MLGSSYSCVSALPLQLVFDHHKVFTKKQDTSGSPNNVANAGSGNGNGNGGRSSRSPDRTFGHTHIFSRTGNGIDTNSGLNTKRSLDNPHNNNNFEKGAHDEINTGNNNELLPSQTTTTGGQQREGVQTVAPIPQTSCELGSDCNSQQDSSNSNHSTSTSTTTTTQEDTPFVLSLPFP